MKSSNPLLGQQFYSPLSLCFIVVTALVLIFPPRTLGESGTGEEPNLGDVRITQAQIAEGILSFKEILDFGVRIFFVISGFIITHLLFIDFEKTGRISLKQFYLRRFWCNSKIEASKLPWIFILGSYSK